MAEAMAMAKRERKPGWWYPWIFVGGMGVVIVVNAIMITFALDTWTGLETENHYLKGLNYNQALAAAEAQEERGWTTEVAFSPGGDRQGELAVTFRDKQGAPLDGLDVTAMMIRPTHEGYDFETPLQPRGNGVYGAEIQAPLPGAWKLRLNAFKGEVPYQEVRRIEIP